MSEENILDKKIEHYIHHRMSQEERLNFENELKLNESLRDTVKLLLSLVSIYNEDLYNLKQKLEETERALDDEKFFKDNK